jgi:hypothetical protein
MPNMRRDSALANAYPSLAVIAMVLLAGLLAIAASPASGVVMVGFVRSVAPILSALRTGTNQYGASR